VSLKWNLQKEKKFKEDVSKFPGMALLASAATKF
jgi:hypothetical protein